MVPGTQQIITADEPLLTPDEAAKRLRVTAEQVRNLIKKGQLGAINVGTGPKKPRYRITLTALQEFLNRRWQLGTATQTRRTKQRQFVRDHFPDLR